MRVGTICTIKENASIRSYGWSTENLKEVEVIDVENDGAGCLVKIKSGHSDRKGNHRIFNSDEKNDIIGVANKNDIIFIARSVLTRKLIEVRDFNILVETFTAQPQEPVVVNLPKKEAVAQLIEDSEDFPF